jgi:hypothetical protein
MLLPLREMDSFTQRQLADLLLLPAHPKQIMAQLAHALQGLLEFFNLKFT